MREVAITGGAGFIGSSLVHRIVKNAARVVVIDDLSTGLESNLTGLDVEFYEVSFTDKEKVRKLIGSVDCIVHLGARGSVPRSLKDPVTTHLVNTQGTLNMLEISRDCGADFIYSSSSSVYGSNLEIPKIENTWLEPLSPYAASKLSAEAFVHAYSYSYGMKTTLLRFFNVFGPRQRPDHEYAAVIPKWIRKALRNETIELFGDGTQSRDFTYIDTVCDVMESALNKEFSSPHVINLAYGNNITLNDLIAKLKDYFPNLKVKISPPRAGDVKQSQNNPARLKEMFPEVIPVNFDVALNQTINWLKEVN